MSFTHFAVFSVLLCLVRCDCILEKDDFTNPQPFFEHNGDFLKPTSLKGTITVKEGDHLVISCANSHVLLAGHNDSTSSTMYSKAICISGKRFLIEDWAVEFSNVTCKKSPEFAVEKLTTRCYNNTHLFGVGYRILRNFYKLYEICFDEALEHTLYSHHTVYPTSSQKKSDGPNFSFIEGGLYNSSKVKYAYKRANEIKRFTQILGEGAYIEPYFKNNQYLARGHLAPRADFPLFNMQKLSYLYANVAPQWAQFNEGDWKNLEEVVHDTKRHAATAFVSINTPHYDSERIAKLTFCKDICETVTQLTWVNWSIKDGITSFCCRYSDFVKIIPHLGDLNVNSVFY